jgi:hypothetical protein
MDERTDPPGPTPEALLVEYQAAQDSAQHHDNLVWTTTGIIWGSSLVLLGFVIANLSTPLLRPIIIVVSILGLLLCAYVWLAAIQFRSIRFHKYRRCKEIERMLNLQQHWTLPYRERIQHTFYAIIMLAFMIAWLVVLLTVLCA